jgi:hypothetical protein
MTRAQAVARLTALEARIVAVERALTALSREADGQLSEDASDAAFSLLSAVDKVNEARRYLDRKVIT